MDLSALQARMTQPSDRLCNDLPRIEGDFIILGLGGKMGPSLAELLLNGLQRAGLHRRVIGVSRFSNRKLQANLEALGIETIAGNLLDRDFVDRLPKARNVIFMAGQKFGTAGNQSYTWAMNALMPGLVARHYADSNIVAFSTGNVYPFTSVDGCGASEDTPLGPVGEYAQSCLGRERIFEYFSREKGTPTLIYRLNYAIDLRYGVLSDIATAVANGNEIDLSMGHVNVIWQGDANEYALRSLRHCTSPPQTLNVTGAEVLEVKQLAVAMGELLGKQPKLAGQPSETALLSDASRCHQWMGPPLVSLDEMMEWTIQWMKLGGEMLNKPTHFQERTGTF